MTRFSEASRSELLARRSASNYPLSEKQKNLDLALGSFVEQASNPANIAAMTAGAFAFRYGKLFGLEGMTATGLTKVLPRFATQSTAWTTGLVAEVAAFRTSHNLMHGQSIAEAFEKNGFAASMIDFALLKTAALGGNNAVLSNFSQSNAMVWGREVSSRLGLIETDSRTYVEKLAEAQATVFALNAGSSLFGSLSGGRVHSLERVLESRLQAMHVTALPALQTLGAQLHSMSATAPEPSQLNGPASSKERTGVLSAPLRIAESLTDRLKNPRSILAYALRRMVKAPNSVKDFAFELKKLEDKFNYDGSPLQGLTSAEGNRPYAEIHRQELARIRESLDTQLKIGGIELGQYLSARDRVVELHAPVREAWDRVIEAERANPIPTSFDKVAEAFQRRDDAIRSHPDLAKAKIGPWEFDLILNRSALETAKAAGDVPHQVRMRAYLGEARYIIEKICAEYDAIASQPEAQRDKAEMNRLKALRFRLEPIYHQLAQGEKIKSGDHTPYRRAKQHYLAFLNTELGSAPYADLLRTHLEAENLYQIHSAQAHNQHVLLAPLNLDRFKTEQLAIHEIDRIEQQWQSYRYSELFKAAQNHAKGLRKNLLNGWAERKFNTALERYNDAVQDYLSYAEKMISENPSAREHTRNSKYRVVFVRLWEMHDTLKSIAKSAKLPEADQIQIVTFVFKTQAQFLARERQGMSGLQALAESTIAMAKPLGEVTQETYSPQTLQALAGLHWGANVVAEYARDVHIFGSAEMLGYYRQQLRPESLMIKGLEAYLPADPAQTFARRAGVLNSMHLGQLEFAATFGIPRLLGLGHAAILAQSGVKMFPIVGPFLGGLMRRVQTGLLEKLPLGNFIAQFLPSARFYMGGGSYVTREKDPKRRQFENYVLEAHVHQGNFSNLYGNGTRDIENPISSPYADLRAHPEALHLPDFHGTRYSTGMPITIASETGSPIIPVAYDLGRIYPEPSMPMPGGWSWKEFFKSPRRAIKPYTGFWQATTMFPYIRPGQDGFSIAYANPITPESLLKENDLRQMPAYREQMEAWDALPPKERQRKVKWTLLQLNFALVRDAEAIAGYTSTLRTPRKSNEAKVIENPAPAQNLQDAYIQLHQELGEQLGTRGISAGQDKAMRRVQRIIRSHLQLAEQIQNKQARGIPLNKTEMKFMGRRVAEEKFLADFIREMRNNGKPIINNGRLGSFHREIIHGVSVYTPELAIPEAKGTVLLIAGSASNHTCFGEQPRRLAEQGYLVKIIVIPGYENPTFMPLLEGGNAHAWNILKNWQTAIPQVVARLIDESSGKIFLGGFSMGAAASSSIYMQLSPNQQSKVAGMILVDPSYNMTALETPQGNNRWFLRNVILPLRVSLGSARQKWQLPVDNELVREDMIYAPLRPMAAEAASVYFIEANRNRLRDAQSEHFPPVLLLHRGQDNPTVRASSGRLVSEVLGDKVNDQVVPGQSHWLLLDANRERAYEQIEAFVADPKPATQRTSAPQ